MRQYLTRLLGRRWTVEAVPDGAAALAAARARVPDLILTDVMMPGLDGFALLRELRADVRTREVPVIILSARAGEESRVEGLEAGADDYLIKPFSARELMARVGAHLELARVRREAADAVRDSQERLNLAMQAGGMGTWDVDLRTGKALWSESHFTLLGYEVVPTGEATFEMWQRRVHPEDRHRVTETLERAKLDRSIYRLEYRIVRADNGMHVWLSVAGRFLYDETGEAVRFIGVFFDITERKRAEAEIKASLAEKEMLLKEIHHRVKNNLQVVASLLYLQADQLKDPTAAAVFEDTQNRIKSMALIHESLYRTGDLAHFNFAHYIENLGTHLFQSYTTGTSRISLHTELDQLALDVDTAIPCGLLLNELLTNALKYAFPEGHSGDIYITLRGDGEHVILSVRDTGIGLPEDFDFRQTESLGLQLVCMLTEQLGGTIEITSGSGTMCAVTFPYPIHPRTAGAEVPSAGRV
jgi:PAS domain S-box-containing protein